MGICDVSFLDVLQIGQWRAIHCIVLLGNLEVAMRGTTMPSEMVSIDTQTRKFCGPLFAAMRALCVEGHSVVGDDARGLELLC